VKLSLALLSTRLTTLTRTGAGKSSCKSSVFGNFNVVLISFLVVSALFRMAELTSGTVLIDGLDARNIPLNILRRKLAGAFLQLMQRRSLTSKQSYRRILYSLVVSLPLDISFTIQILLQGQFERIWIHSKPMTMPS
jgi:hypothetical protein